jgi:hypothetical protein
MTFIKYSDSNDWHWHVNISRKEKIKRVETSFISI